MDLPADTDSADDGSVPADAHLSVLELPVAADGACMAPRSVAAAIEALSTALRDPQTRVIVLGLRPQAQDGASGSVDALHDLLLALWDSDKPIVAALDADTSGAGLGLALACDLVVAARGIHLRIDPALLRSGRCAAACWLAGRRLPAAAAAALAMGWAIDSARAHALGLVLELAAPQMALQQARQIGRRLAQQSPQHLAQSKQLLRSCREQTLAQHLDDERLRWLRDTA